MRGGRVLISLLAFLLYATPVFGQAYIESTDFYLEATKGNRAKHTSVRSFGSNPDIDTTTDPEDVWYPGGQFHWPTGAVAMRCESDNANDDGNPDTNTGAQELTITGLDGTFTEVVQTITTNGVSWVNLATDLMRINWVEVTESGTYHGSNIGEITCQATSGTHLMLTFPAGGGRTQVGRYSCETGHTCYMGNILISANADTTKPSRITLNIVENVLDVTQPYSGAKRILLDFKGVAGPVPLVVDQPITIPGESDVWWTVEEVQANDTAVSINFEILKVED